MADIAFPTLSTKVATEMRLTPLAPAQAFRSPFDGSLQTGSTQGPRWRASLRIRRLEEDDADTFELQAWLMKLRGQANRALIPNFARLVPRGTITLTGVTVNGALSAGASQVTLAGCGNAKTLLTGDFMKMGDQVVMVVDGPYTSTAGGAMSNVKFEHPLRAAVSNGASVTLDTPTIRMVLVGPESGWDSLPPTVTELYGLDFEEAFS